MSGIAVIFGGPAPEHDVSILTGLQAVRELERQGNSPLALYWAKTGEWFQVPASSEGTDFLDGVPRSATPIRLVIGEGGGFVALKSGMLSKERPLEVEVALVCCHGSPGEDGTLQGVLDLAGIAYAGPNLNGAALGMDKLAFGAVAVGAGVNSLPRAALRADADSVHFAGPYIVKPRFGGSSLGIEVVEDHETAASLLATAPLLRQGAVIEPYRPDLADYNVAVRSYPSLQVSAIEKPIKGSSLDGGILGYADKYVGGEGMSGAPRELPADLPEEIATMIRASAKRLAIVAGVRGIARIDFLVKDDEVYVNEINTIPGSLARYLWVDPPVSFGELLSDLIEEARKFPTHAYSTVGADGTVLRSASSIASKLA